MARSARIHAPGATVHLISRFVDGGFRLAGLGERAVVLKSLPASLARTDWTLLGYALMSSHLHLVLQAGINVPWRLLKPLHTVVARRLNLRDGSLGPVFAGRATTLLVPDDRVAILLAYVHNNPVRAHVVTRAAASPWTSHRAYLRLDPAPDWLAGLRGLELAGFPDTTEGRLAFDEFVASRAERPTGETDTTELSRIPTTVPARRMFSSAGVLPVATAPRWRFITDARRLAIVAGPSLPT